MSPARGPAALRRRWNAIAVKDIGYRLVADSISQLPTFSLNPRIAPFIFFRQLDNEPAKLR